MATARPVMIVEDNDVLRGIITDHLLASGEFNPIEAISLREATQLLNAADARFDAVLLDVRMPDGDGADYCFDLRRKGHKMPIIILGGPYGEDDIVRGLDAGANDYICNTKRLDELLARLRAQLRLFNNSVDAVFTIGSYTFRPAAKLLVNSKTNRRIGLTNKEVDLLKSLYQADGSLVTRQILLSEVWGYNKDVPSTTLDTHIYTLRRKLAADPNMCGLLITVSGGYQLAAHG